MRALKINFGGPNKVSIDWNGEVSGLAEVAQKASVSVMTRLGSDQFIPTRGTSVVDTLFSYGVFDLMSMQHTLNFGSLKARRDVRGFEPVTLTDGERVANVQMSLLGVESNVANVGIRVSTQDGQETTEITSIA